MADLTSLVELYKSCGFSPKAALEKAEARERELRAEARERELSEFIIRFIAI